MLLIYINILGVNLYLSIYTLYSSSSTVIIYIILYLLIFYTFGHLFTFYIFISTLGAFLVPKPYFNLAFFASCNALLFFWQPSSNIL